MFIVEEISLNSFPYWGGAIDTVKYLTESEIDIIEDILMDAYPNGMSQCAINDLFWFDNDILAEWLGYNDFEEIINREEE